MAKKGGKMRIIYIVVCCILLYSIYNLGYMHGYRSGIYSIDREMRKTLRQHKNRRIPGSSIVVTFNGSDHVLTTVNHIKGGF